MNLNLHNLQLKQNESIVKENADGDIMLELMHLLLKPFLPPRH